MICYDIPMFSFDILRKRSHIFGSWFIVLLPLATKWLSNVTTVIGNFLYGRDEISCFLGNINFEEKSHILHFTGGKMETEDIMSQLVVTSIMYRKNSITFPTDFDRMKKIAIHLLFSEKCFYSKFKRVVVASLILFLSVLILILTYCISF